VSDHGRNNVIHVAGERILFSQTFRVIFAYVYGLLMSQSQQIDR